jgi:nucleoside-diphosphate-sugar epimerase
MLARMASGGKRIVFTGGSGKAGRHVIPELIKRGHKVSIGVPVTCWVQY